MASKTHLKYLKLQQKYERHILATFARANASQIVEGKAWYPYAKAQLSQYVSLWGMERAAAICAVLSPRCTWQENLIGVRKIARAFDSGSRIVPVMAGLNRNIDKAWDIANGDSLQRVSGPKVTRFYANLCGDLQRVTCDVWAARAAGCKARLPKGATDEQIAEETARLVQAATRPGYAYDTLEKAYQNVAAKLGFEPAELQAICWIVVRGKGE